MTNLIWIDCEMTGLDPFKDRLLEIAVIITTENLDIIAQGPSYVIGQPLSVLSAMDQWNTEHHTKSGLWQQALESAETVESVQEKVLKFISLYTSAQKSPLCGNTIHQDRFFLRKWMPQLESFMHYRNIDVSTLKQVFPVWSKTCKAFTKEDASHRALDDILQSIQEMKYYRNYFQSLESGCL